jgi:hypothetical protein
MGDIRYSLLDIRYSLFDIRYSGGGIAARGSADMERGGVGLPSGVLAWKYTNALRASRSTLRVAKTVAE